MRGEGVDVWGRCILEGRKCTGRSVQSVWKTTRLEGSRTGVSSEGQQDSRTLVAYSECSGASRRGKASLLDLRLPKTILPASWAQGDVERNRETGKALLRQPH